MPPLPLCANATHSATTPSPAHGCLACCWRSTSTHCCQVAGRHVGGGRTHSDGDVAEEQGVGVGRCTVVGMQWSRRWWQQRGGIFCPGQVLAMTSLGGEHSWFAHLLTFQGDKGCQMPAMLFCALLTIKWSVSMKNGHKLDNENWTNWTIRNPTYSTRIICS